MYFVRHEKGERGFRVNIDRTISYADTDTPSFLKQFIPGKNGTQDRQPLHPSDERASVPQAITSPQRTNTCVNREHIWPGGTARPRDEPSPINYETPSSPSPSQSKINRRSVKKVMHNIIRFVKPKQDQQAHLPQPKPTEHTASSEQSSSEESDDEQNIDRAEKGHYNLKSNPRKKIIHNV